MGEPIDRAQTPVSGKPPVTARFLVTREDYADFRAAAGMAAVSPSEFRLIRVCGAALLVSCFVFLFTYETGVQYFLLDALLGFCGLFLLGWRKMLPLWLRARAGSLYAENSRLVEACTVSVGEGGLRVERPQYRAGLPFEALAWAYEDRAVFLFSLGAGMFCFLPKRCLSGEECVQIRNYLSSALRKKFRQEGFHG